MNIESVDKIGQGRVWTGYDAKKIGLIDTYGGIEKAIKIAKSLAKIENYRVISLPKKQDPFTELMLNLEGEASIYKLIKQKIAFNSEKLNHIEDLISTDIIQARVPFFIELK